MSTHDGLITGLVPVGASRLITDPEQTPVFTLTRSADARSALTIGVKEYLEQLSIVFAGRTVLFKKVYARWPEPEADASYPTATIYTESAGTYDASRFTPGLNAANAIPGVPGAFLAETCELVQRLTVEVWTTEEIERRAVVSMLEDAFTPVDWMYGARLALPHYHGVFCTLEPEESEYLEDDRDAQRRLRKIKFYLKGTLPLVRVYRDLPLATPDRIRVSVQVTVGPVLIPTGRTGPGGDPEFISPPSG